MLRYPGVIHKEDDGYWIEFPDLKGCTTEGDTMEELIEMAQDALSGYLGIIFDQGEEMPGASDIEGENIIYVDVPPRVAIPIILKNLRKEKGLSQSEIAERINRKYQTYQRFENVKTFNARIKTLEEIAKALGKKLVVEFR